MKTGKGRAPCCDQSVVKKGPWSPKEDAMLVSHINQFGYPNWRAVPAKAGLLRCGKSCRLRWLNYLNPDIRRGNFSLEEHEDIIKLHKEYGNKWSKIASELPGRTDNEIKNFWNTHLKKRSLEDNSNPISNKTESKTTPGASTSLSSSTCSSPTTTSSAKIVGSNEEKPKDDLQIVEKTNEDNNATDKLQTENDVLDTELWDMLHSITSLSSFDDICLDF